MPRVNLMETTFGYLKIGRKNGPKLSYNLLEHGAEYLSEASPSFPLHLVMMG